ncbi:MAG: hypothetical protein ACYDG4_16065 [Desulfuromonadaceae bacterium]
MEFIKDNSVNATGSLSVVLRGTDGLIKQEQHVKNLVVTAGKNLIASRLSGAVTGVNATMSHMAVGSSAAIAAAANAALGTELGRVALSSTSVVDNVITYTAVFPAGSGTGALVEAGILNAGTAGTLLCRTVFDVVNKASTDSLTVIWNVTIG